MASLQTRCLQSVTPFNIPDLSRFELTWGNVFPIGNDPQRIVIESIFTLGTFTGKPYRVLPGVFPEAQPNGAFINNNDEQRFKVEVYNGWITRVEVYALGISTGFAGFYTKAGGSLVPRKAVAVDAVMVKKGRGKPRNKPHNAVGVVVP